MLRKNGNGNIYFRHKNDQLIREPTLKGDITSMNLRFKKKLKMQLRRRTLIRQLIVIVFGIHFYSLAANFLFKYLFIPLNIGNLISFFILSLLTYLIFFRIYNFLRKIIKVEILPAVNNIGGLIFGFCRGFVFSVFIAMILLLIPLAYVTDSVKKNSRLAPFFIRTGAILYEKTAGIVSKVKTERLKQLLSGAEPLKFEILNIKKRDIFE